MERSSERARASLLHRYNSGELSAEQFVREYFEVLQGRPRLEKTMDELERIVSRGEEHLRAWRELYRAMRGDDAGLVDLASRYFMITAIAHLQMATLQAAKLMETRRDSVNLQYLLNVLASECQDSFPSNWEEVRRTVEDDRGQLLGLRASLTSIKTERDKRIAHHDRSVLDAGPYDEVARVEVTELDRLFQTVRSMLATYHTLYYGTAPARATLSQDEVDFVGPPGLADLFDLARRALDDESIDDVSNHVKQVRAWRKALRSAEQALQLPPGRGSAYDDIESDDAVDEEQ